MRPVRRGELVDHVTYRDTRDAFRAQVMAAKAVRRVHVGEHLTLLFENPLTVRYQIQEMMRAEQIVRERDIQHELDTYNALLGGPGELGATLLIEVEDAAERAAKLSEWRALPGHVYLVLEDGTRVPARFDERQRDEHKLSSVQYMTFDVGDRTPVAAGVDLPGLTAEVRLTDEQRRALAEDLAAG